MTTPSVETTLARAKAHQKKGRPQDARALCRDVLDRFPSNARARALLASLPEPAPSQELLEKLVAAHKAGHTALVAEQAARLLPIYPESYVLWQIHGGVLLDLGAYPQAEESLRRASELRPDLPEARVNHSVALRATGQCKQAEQTVRAALAQAPDHRGAILELAAVLTARGDLPAAAALCQKVIAQDPDVAMAHNILGVSAHEEGRLSDALTCYARAVDIEPGFAEAHRNLAALKPWTDMDAHLAQMETLFKDQTLDPMDRARICFALFDAWNGLGKPEKAWPFLKMGNAIRKALMGYDIAQDIALFERLKSWDVLPLTDVAPAPVVPIFILGMPRSGTTVTEQIVSAHHDVAAGGELPLAGELARDALAGTQLTEATVRHFRQSYLAGLAEHAGGAAFVTDKMPHNFYLVPLICAALPEARIVHVRRDAAAVCWSNLRQYFTAGSLGYCYDPDDVVAYHGLYRDWMDRCAADWPGRLRGLDHDALGARPATEIRALVADLGLDWDPACLAPQDNPNHVHTASAAQVRQPIYRASSDAWRPYAPHIGEIFAHLLSVS
jgi:Flp pilus assembly protein TadD